MAENDALWPKPDRKTGDGDWDRRRAHQLHHQQGAWWM